jgi:leucyl aminopeptidase (aminopeptidase T)
MGAEGGVPGVVEACMGLREGEKALVITDPPKQALAEALFQACMSRSKESVLVKIPARRGPQEEPPLPVASMMTDADAIFLVTSQSMTHTQARRNACRAGARVLSMPGITEAMVAEGALAVDHGGLEEAMRRVHKRLRGATSLRVLTEHGSDLTFDVKGRDWITNDTGICRRRGECASLPAGEIFIAPREGSAEGKLVVDQVFGEPVPAPATITLQEGYAVRVLGAQGAVLEMNRGGLEGRNFARFGFGLNPRARLTGNPLEDTKVLGAVHVAFGDNTALGGRVRVGVQVDCLTTNATLEANGKPILERGKLRL